MNGGQFFKALRIINKLDIKNLLSTIDFGSFSKVQTDKSVASKIGMDVITTILPELYLIETEFFDFIADVKGIEPEKAKKLEINEIKDILVETFKGIGVINFLKQAASMNPNLRS